MKNAHKIMECSLSPIPNINLFLGLERGDLGKMERALKAGATGITHPIYGNTLLSSDHACCYDNVWDMAKRVDLPEEGIRLLKKYLNPHS